MEAARSRNVCGASGRPLISPTQVQMAAARPVSARWVHGVPPVTFVPGVRLARQQPLVEGVIRHIAVQRAAGHSLAFDSGLGSFMGACSRRIPLSDGGTEILVT